MHGLTEDYDNGELVSLLGAGGDIKFSTLEWKMFERYIDFVSTIKPEMESIEESFVSEKLGYAGTVDRICMIGKERWLIDIKTSNSMHKSQHLQLATYVKLYNESYPDKPIDRVGILWLKAKTRGPRDGKIQGRNWALVESPESLEHYQSLFDHTYALWNEENASMKPNNIVYKLEHKKHKQTKIKAGTSK